MLWCSRVRHFALARSRQSWSCLSRHSPVQSIARSTISTAARSEGTFSSGAASQSQYVPFNAPSASSSTQSAEQVPNSKGIDRPDFTATKNAIETIVGYRFNDPAYLEAALSEGDMYVGTTRIQNCQQHLAIIGDSALKLSYYAVQFPSHDWKAMTLLSNKVSSNRHLANVVVHHRLHKQLHRKTIPSSMQFPSAKTPGSIWKLATGLEALMDAVFLDSGSKSEVVDEIAQRLIGSVRVSDVDSQPTPRRQSLRAARVASRKAAVRAPRAGERRRVRTQRTGFGGDRPIPTSKTMTDLKAALKAKAETKLLSDSSSLTAAQPNPQATVNGPP